MIGHEAAIVCRQTGVEADCGSNRAHWKDGLFRWKRPHTPVEAFDLASDRWELVPVEPPEPGCPEGHELWPLAPNPMYGRLEVQPPSGRSFTPVCAAIDYPDRFCGWRFVDRHGKEFYRLDTWQLYPSQAVRPGNSWAGASPPVPVNATHALMRKEACKEEHTCCETCAYWFNNKDSKAYTGLCTRSAPKSVAGNYPGTEGCYCCGGWKPKESE